MSQVAVIGGGAWGTALAQAAADAGHDVRLCLRDPSLAEAINQGHENPRYLPGQVLSTHIGAQAGYAGVGQADLVLMVAPAQASRVVLGEIGAGQLAGKPVVLCAKGLERKTLDRQSQILGDTAPEAVPLVLSGPSFAADVAAGRPTAVTLAARDAGTAENVARLLAGPGFRPYASGDLVGVELAGALKNVYALGCGAVEGAGLGESARAALIARAYAEMSRLVVAMGGQAATLTGLAGLGDLTLSCTSVRSRNYRFGIELGRGQRPEKIATSGVGLAEGVTTAPVAQGLGRRHGIDLPLTDAVCLLLAGSLGIDQIVAQLMARPLKRESDVV